MGSSIRSLRIARGLTQEALALESGVTRNVPIDANTAARPYSTSASSITRRRSKIVHGKRAITADTALRLSRALGLSDMFWVNMQAHYDA